MKKAILILLAAFWMNAGVAQTNTGMDVQTINTPATVTNKFKADNPNVNATWTMDGENYSAAYRDPLTNLDRVIVYDRNGNLVHSDYELDYASYPKAISDYYVTNHPKDKDYKVWSSSDENGDLIYFSKRSSGKTEWFDKDGNYSSTKPVKIAHKSGGTKKSAGSK